MWLLLPDRWNVVPCTHLIRKSVLGLLLVSSATDLSHFGDPIAIISCLPLRMLDSPAVKDALGLYGSGYKEGRFHGGSKSTLCQECAKYIPAISSQLWGAVRDPCTACAANSWCSWPRCSSYCSFSFSLADHVYNSLTAAMSGILIPIVRIEGQDDEWKQQGEYGIEFWLSGSWTFIALLRIM